MDHPTTIPELLAAIETEHERLVAVLAQLDHEQLTAPLLHDGWSVKDELAHITFWERRMLFALRPVAEGGSDVTIVPPEIADIPYSETWTDDVNEFIYQRNHDRSFADVRADFDRSYPQVLERIATLAPEDIFTPGTLAPSGDAALVVIGDNTYDHYHEHADSIQRVVK